MTTGHGSSTLSIAIALAKMQRVMTVFCCCIISTQLFPDYHLFCFTQKWMQVGNRSLAIARCAFPQDALVRPAITSWNNVYWESTLGSLHWDAVADDVGVPLLDEGGEAGEGLAALLLLPLLPCQASCQLLGLPGSCLVPAPQMTPHQCIAMGSTLGTHLFA